MGRANVRREREATAGDAIRRKFANESEFFNIVFWKEENEGGGGAEVGKRKRARP